MSRTHKDTKKYLEEHHGPLWWMSGGVPSNWKQLRRKSRRAKEMDALRLQREPPIFKKSDKYDWW